MICTMAMLPATVQLPDISQEIKNVVPDPVRRQVTVLIMLRVGESFKAHLLSYFGSRNSMCGIIKSFLLYSIAHITSVGDVGDVRNY